MRKRVNKIVRWVQLHLDLETARLVREARLAAGLSTVAYLERLVRETMKGGK